MTRSRRVLIALLTAVAMFFAASRSGAEPVRGGAPTIRRASPITSAIVALRVVAATAKARAAEHAPDALPFDLFAPPEAIAIAEAAYSGRIAIITLSQQSGHRAATTTRARAPPNA